MRAWLSRPIRATVLVLAIGLSVVRAADEVAALRIRGTVPAPTLAYPNSAAVPAVDSRSSVAANPSSGVVQAVGMFPEGTSPRNVVHPEDLAPPRSGRLGGSALGITSGGFDFSGVDQGVVPAGAVVPVVPIGAEGAVYGNVVPVSVVPPPGALPVAAPAVVPVVPPPSAPSGYQPVATAAATTPMTTPDGRERIVSTYVNQVVPASAPGYQPANASQAVANTTVAGPVQALPGATISSMTSYLQGDPPPPAESVIMDHEPGDMQGMQQSMNGCKTCGGEDDEADNYTIALERVPIALLQLEPGYTLGKRDVMRIRLDGAYGWQNPDRLEYLQARARADGGAGPEFRERQVDYQDIRFSMIRSGPKFQLGTDMGLRSIDGDINHESIGMADLTVNTKIVMVDEDKYKISQIMTIYTPTGYVLRGMGAGHVSMEPGFALSYQISPRTYAHANLGYWIPIAANPAVTGQMWHHGIGLSTILWDHPVQDRAVLGMLEFDGWTILTGFQTNFNTGALERLNPESIFNVNPGLRFILNEKVEVALGLGFRITTTHWYEEMFRLETRMMF